MFGVCCVIVVRCCVCCSSGSGYHGRGGGGVESSFFEFITVTFSAPDRSHNVSTRVRKDVYVCGVMYIVCGVRNAVVCSVAWRLPIFCFGKKR